ncbi:MAG: FtsW/RodA/SpoVE family cell cycle protein [Lachnospiraceae bacterium]|nr:FtsW/RodA/SpoVE family cell cycle protein [Lachnospiraceae bacterium]
MKNAKQQLRIQNFDFLLILLCGSLTVIGTLAIYSADENLAMRHLYGFLLGLGAAIFIAVLDYHIFLKFYWIFYILNIVLLVLVLLYGYSSHNAQRWLVVAGIRFQPAEAAKILLILFYAAFIMKYSGKMKYLLFDLLCLLLALPPIYLVYRQPDLSTSIMLVLIFLVLMFVGGIRMRLVASLVAIAVPAVPLLFYYALKPDSPLIRSFQQRRILAWLHPEDYATTEAYQTLNSLMAIGSGQLHGKGFDTNEIGSVLSSGFISESQTDFIYTVIGEEFGFVGACAVILLILAITVDAYVIAARAPDVAGRLIAAGLGTWVGFQGFLNIGVATGVVPNTGIPLPFVSSGLTSLLSTYAGVGFVLSVRMQSGDTVKISPGKEFEGL